VDLASRIPSVLESHETDRYRLCDILAKQNASFAAGPETIANIELLRRPGTVAVLTGQQAGLFTGPLYTVYKALSAVRAAECLRSRGFDAVPVFWAATEDHDFAEVSKASVVTPDAEIADVGYIPASYSEGQPVGAVKLDDSAAAAVDELLSNVPATEFSDYLRAMLVSSYGDGQTYGTAFAGLISRLFAPYGLIVVDPLDRDLKHLASPIYKKAIKDSAATVAAIVARSRELTAAGYHAQVEVGEDYFPLFWHDDEGKRTSLKIRDGRAVVNGSKTSFSMDELAAIADETPERFSPGVMLRPVVQDYLFPTVCYFGGGAEIAYFAQNSETYRVLDRPVTPILHRQSFTVVEGRIGRNLEQLGLEFSDIFRPFESLRSEVVAKVVDPDSAALFADVEEKINSELRRLDELLASFDGPLAESFANRRKKIIYHLAATRNKFERERLRKDATADRRLRSVMANLLPGGHLQERTINVAQYLDRYGEYFIDWIYRCIDLDDQGHRIIYL
jgi:bacillithiol biosynthesis cysteine-adding enzyme BshC